MNKFYKLRKIDFYQIFKRKTTSAFFLPEIDGLRFLAILFVIICHVQALYLLRVNYEVSYSKCGKFLQALFLHNGDSGVLLFFTISGFILMLPFARFCFNQSNKVPLKKYYLRRLTRLEPPYLLVIFFLFAMKIFIQNKDFGELLPHLGASLLYLHTAIFNEVSKITPITWSLEVEIQFYLLAPALATIFKLPKFLRRALLAVLILIPPFFQHLLGLSNYTFLGTMQYFFVGFMLVDFYLCEEKIKIRESFARLLGGLLLVSLIVVSPTNFSGKFFYPLLILFFYYLVLNTGFWKHAFQNKFLTSVGGMCYSLYLLHFAIISLFGMKSFSLKISDSYAINVLLQLIVHLPIILLISSIFYLLIERPCMDSRWPKKVWFWLKGRYCNLSRILERRNT